MKQPLVSVIVPVYNGDLWIQDCIDSILAQNLTDFELLLVNDGSADRTEVICRQVRDSRVRYVCQAHQGVSLAREHGLRLARGVYIAFVDADDTIAPDYLHIMTAAMEQQAACDLVCCNSTDNRSYETDITHTDRYITDRQEIIQDYFSHKRYAFCIWGKLFRRELLEQIHFPDMIYAEDTYVLHTYLRECKMVRLISYAGYCYRDNPDGAMHRKMTLRSVLDLLRCSRLICEEWTNSDSALREPAIKQLTDHLFYVLLFLSEQNVRSTIWEDTFLTLPLSVISKSTKGRILLLYRRHPRLVSHILRQYRKWKGE